MHGLKLLELAPDSNGVLEVRVPRPTASVGLANTTALMLPLRMIGLNRRWSVGVLQLRGGVRAVGGRHAAGWHPDSLHERPANLQQLQRGRVGLGLRVRVLGWRCVVR